MPHNKLITFMLESSKNHNKFKNDLQQSMVNLDSESFATTYNNFKTYLNRNKTEEELKNPNRDTELIKIVIGNFFDFFKNSKFDKNNLPKHLDICNEYININIIGYYFWFLEDKENCKICLMKNVDSNSLTLEHCEFLDETFEQLKLSLDDRILNKDKVVIHNSFIEFQNICHNYKNINDNNFQSNNKKISDTPIKKYKI